MLIIGLDKSGKTTLLEKIKVRCLACTPQHVCVAASKGTFPSGLRDSLLTSSARREPYVALHVPHRCMGLQADKS